MLGTTRQFFSGLLTRPQGENPYPSTIGLPFFITAIQQNPPRKVDGNVIEFNIPTGKTRGPLASKYRVELKDLDSEASEVILSGPLTVANDDK